MRFAESVWLWGVVLAALVGLVLAWGGLAHQRALRRFGDLELVTGLKTARTGPRRALRSVLFVLALALAFVAAAQPQYGRGTRLIPATNLDVIVVLDFSKSMYARDVSPSRIARAKAELSQLVRELPGARFAGVAFAGTPMSFPLTSDGAAVLQFFRGLEPNDMPVGGTAIARALDAARQLFERDPKSPRHERVVVLITDGEDLEGDPVAVAEALAQSGITVHVVQIGGQSPEPIPDIDEQGQMKGLRQDASGRLLTTSLSAEGEAELAKIASSARGKLIRAEKGTTGVLEIARELRRLKTDELSEQVETVYADVYAYPLILSLVFLLLEAFIGAAPRRRPRAPEPPPRLRTRAPTARSRRRPVGETLAAITLGLSLLGCQRVDEVLDEVFQHFSPVVDEAIGALEQKRPAEAVQLLTSYLETGPCEAGVIGTPDRVRSHPDATFDLALGLYELAEQHGAPQGPEESQSRERDETIACAQRLVAPLGLDTSLPLALRARAHYLAGNLSLLKEDYRAAITSYDAALRLIPGFAEATEEDSAPPDGIGRDAAHNRAVALRRLAEQPPEEKDEDQEQDDQQNQDQNEQEQDQKQDSDPEKQEEEKDEPKSEEQSEEPKPEEPKSEDSRPEDTDSPPESDDERDQKQAADDAREPPRDPEKQESPASAASDPSQQQDERILDELEQAPTLQQHDARQDSRRIRGRSSMEDK